MFDWRGKEHAAPTERETRCDVEAINMLLLWSKNPIAKKQLTGTYVVRYN